MSLRVRPFERPDTECVIALWRAAGLTRAWNDPRKDIERKLQVQPELFLVAIDGDAVVGSVMAGYDGHRGWLYYLASDPARRGEGIGRLLVTEAERRLEELGCPKVQLMVRPDNIAARGFYDALGYESFDIWATGKRLIADA
ncbi:GNAT family acetyltransferase [Microbacterium sp.]|jgi:ribosomal protein S18 acetylase RimI-like enzyme|uniref:GNAT family acetyltransferase n=1 Tax=Microbacterium sp. TaxID=51671 RepID=UPI002CF23443|nr:GNAT family acetyltransferase [Microbacterium sp.]HWL76417.1 GNAT family acetyltransferase [Microbacterium sp.]